MKILILIGFMCGIGLGQEDPCHYLWFGAKAGDLVGLYKVSKKCVGWRVYSQYVPHLEALKLHQAEIKAGITLLDSELVKDLEIANNPIKLNQIKTYYASRLKLVK